MEIDYVIMMATLAGTVLTGLLVLINAFLAAASIRAANAAKVSAAIAAKEFRLARMPAVSIAWESKRDNGNIIATGRIRSLVDTSMLLSALTIKTRAYPKISGTCKDSVVMQGGAMAIINSETVHQTPVIRFISQYRIIDGQRREEVGEIRISLAIEPLGMPENKETFTMVSHVRSDGTMGQSYREHQQQPPVNWWQRLRDYINDIRD